MFVFCPFWIAFDGIHITFLIPKRVSESEFLKVMEICETEKHFEGSI